MTVDSAGQVGGGAGGRDGQKGSIETATTPSNSEQRLESNTTADQTNAAIVHKNDADTVLIESRDLELMDADRITRFYRVPCTRFKHPDDIVRHYGYRLGERIAEGGFGKIYVAKHIKTGVQVACKQLDLSKCKLCA